ncbi:calcium homeostasis endoplasmic reticulum protein isoform X2 [Sigmodon hispidus]
MSHHPGVVPSVSHLSGCSGPLTSVGLSHPTSSTHSSTSLHTRHPFERPPYPPHFDYPQGDFPTEMGPPNHQPGHLMPHRGINEHPPFAGPQHPDFGPPPHGFNGQPHHMRRQGPPHINHDDLSLVPNVPYFDLPEGLRAPLVKLEDHEYKPLDPKDIRLLPPMPPSERLLAAVEAFYSPPSHDRPRNKEGWEQNGLYELFWAKMRARWRKGQEKRNSVPFRSCSMSKSQGRSSSRSSSRSSKSSRSSSRSRSRSSSRSRSRSRSKSYSPGRRRCSRSRSPTPPSAAGLGSNSAPPIPDSRQGEENKGHQMLVKMGWSGSGGLGPKEQGIQDPIKGGDVRDKWDQYKGVGVSLDDLYENYRHNKSYSFIARMKAPEMNSPHLEQERKRKKIKQASGQWGSGLACTCPGGGAADTSLGWQSSEPRQPQPQLGPRW